MLHSKKILGETVQPVHEQSNVRAELLRGSSVLANVGWLIMLWGKALTFFFFINIYIFLITNQILHLC